MLVLFKKEVLLVKFPIIFPIIYGLILFFFPQFETQLIFLTILLLAETHFGATWPFFVHKTNYVFIKENKISLIFIPIILSVFCLFGFFYFKMFFLLIFFAANVYHVTRQSFGVMSLYIKYDKEKKIYANLIYIFNFFFFVVAFFRFYIPIIKPEDLILINILVLCILMIVFILCSLKFKLSENLLTMVTGVIIFYPVCFVSSPVHAIIMGVTMHYTQYLYLTNKVVLKRNINLDIQNYFIDKFWIIIGIYALIMACLSLLGSKDSIFLNQLIIIPIIGQMLHFYLDSQLWKFSNSHNRESILRHLK